MKLRDRLKANSIVFISLCVLGSSQFHWLDVEIPPSFYWNFYVFVMMTENWGMQWGFVKTPGRKITLCGWQSAFQLTFQIVNFVIRHLSLHLKLNDRKVPYTLRCRRQQKTSKRATWRHKDFNLNIIWSTLPTNHFHVNYSS